MRNFLRLTTHSILAGMFGLSSLALQACSGTATGGDGGHDGGSACAPGNIATIEANCHCNASVDCTAGNSALWACSPAHSCIQICTKASDCTVDGTGYVCEDLICRPPACGDDSECNSGQQCIGGACASAVSTVASCKVTPGSTVINAGGTKTFWAVGYDSTGAAVPYEGAVTWASSDTNLTTASMKSAASFAAATGTAAGTATITATVGSATCTATAQEYATVATGSCRVVVVDLTAGTPVSGATVVVDDAAAATTGADGSATVTCTGTTHTASVYDTGYTFTTVVGTAATDMLIPIKATPTGAHAVGNFNGELSNDNFNNISNPAGTLHLDISGGSVPGNLIDLSLSTLLGPSQSVTISLGTATSYGPFNLPEGIALGLGPTMFGPGATGGDYGIVSVPGTRALWSLGGNAVIGDVLKAIGPVLSGGTGSIGSEIPTILTAILPILGTLESAVTSGVSVTPGEMSTLTFGPSTPSAPGLQLTTLMRLHLNVKTPTLSTTVGGKQQSYLDDSGMPVAFDGAIILGGVEAPPQGLIPLGLTAGVDQTNSAGAAMMPDGIVDPASMGAQPGQLPMRVAPRHGGIEGAKWAFVTLGASLSSLVGGLGSSAGSTDGGSSSSSEVILAGHVTFPAGPIVYNNGAEFPLDLSAPFMAPPSGMGFAVTGGVITTPMTDTGAVFHRMDIGSTGGWSVYFKGGQAGATITLPTPPTGFTSPAVAGASVTLQSVSLGYNTPAGSMETYDGVWTFDGVDATDLTAETDNFTARGMPDAM